MDDEHARLAELNDLVAAMPRLREESFGDKMRRSRRAAGLTVREATGLVNLFWPVSQTSMQRLERCSKVPSQRRVRVTATLALAIYLVDPEQFGLDLDELPAIDTAALERTMVELRGRRERGAS